VQETLEAIGLQMAADVNASTGPDTTTFILDLPRNDRDSLSTGLDVMRQLVSDMTIAPEAVNAERGVVLAEERSRAGPGMESAFAMLRLQVGDHPDGRPPIGLRKVIETVTPQTIHGFYDAFYRPERGTLLVVGDVDPSSLIPMISIAFGDWKGRGPAGKDPTPITVKPSNPDVSMVLTPGAPDTSLMLRWFEPWTAIRRRTRPSAGAWRLKASARASSPSACSVSTTRPANRRPVLAVRFRAPSTMSGVARSPIRVA